MQHEVASPSVMSGEADENFPVASHPGANRSGPRDLVQRPDDVWVPAYVVETDFDIFRIEASNVVAFRKATGRNGISNLFERVPPSNGDWLLAALNFFCF
jgi:hypothetical protein